jgi:lysozyme
MATKSIKVDWTAVDNKKLRDYRDRKRISCEEKWEVDYLVDFLKKHFPEKEKPAIRAAIFATCGQLKAPHPRDQFVQNVVDRLQSRSLPPMRPSSNCYQLLKKFEGLVLRAYKDKAGKWTIGYGCTFYENSKPVKIGDIITKERAEQLFRFIVDDFAKHINTLISVKLAQHQFDALVSFAYNVGLDMDDDDIAEGLGDSTLLKLINKNPNDPQIYDEFQKWIKSTINGKKVVLPELKERRKLEANLYFNKRK